MESKLIKTETVMEYSDKSRRIETASKDDEIIVKTTSWPVHQAPSKDSNGLDDTDKDLKNFEVNSGGSDDTDNDVINKAYRGRMKFPTSSNCSSAPADSCLNNHNISSWEHLHHKPHTSTEKANHQEELSEDNNSKLQYNLASTKKKTSCHLN